MSETHKITHTDSTEEQLQLVGFNLGNEEFGIEILKVQEINRVGDITKVPQSPDFVDGVINLRGAVIPMIDLRRRFGLKGKEYDKQTRIIVAELEDKTFGFVVDAVTEVIRLPEDSIEPTPHIFSGQHSDYIHDVGKLKDSLLMLPDLEKILTENEIAQISEMENV